MLEENPLPYSLFLFSYFPKAKFNLNAILHTVTPILYSFMVENGNILHPRLKLLAI